MGSRRLLLCVVHGVRPVALLQERSTVGYCTREDVEKKTKKKGHKPEKEPFVCGMQGAPQPPMSTPRKQNRCMRETATQTQGLIMIPAPPFLISKTFTLAGSFVSVFSLSQHLFKLVSLAVNSIL
jgi:hypothetical protein